MRTFKTSRVPGNHELYEKVVRFLFIVLSTKSRTTNQYTVTVSFISPLFVFTSETSETLWSNVGNLRKTSVEPRRPSKFFGSFSEIVERLRTTFGNLPVNFRNLRKTSDHLRKSSEDLGHLRMSCGQFRMFLEDFAFISENFVSSYLESTIWEKLVLL